MPCEVWYQLVLLSQLLLLMTRTTTQGSGILMELISLLLSTNQHAIIVTRIQVHFSNDGHEYRIPNILGILVLTYWSGEATNEGYPSMNPISITYSKDETILIKVSNNTIPDILDISVIEIKPIFVLIIKSSSLITQINQVKKDVLNRGQRILHQ